MKVVALTSLAEGAYPPVAAVFGTGLPPRNIQSPGSTVEVTTLAQLRAAIQSGTTGRTVRLTAPIDLGGNDLVVNCVGAAISPITVYLAAPVRNGRVLISRAAYVNVRFTELASSPIDGLKITDGSHHVDVDGRGGVIRDTKGQGILITDSATRDWQIWNTRIVRAGSNGSLDHGIYAATAKGECSIANVIVTDPSGYGYQIYPDCQGLIVTGCESHGSATRGGMVVGSENSLTHGITVVGLMVSRSKYGAVSAYPPSTPVDLGFVFDSVGYDNSGGGFATRMNPTHCEPNGLPGLAKGWVQPARFPLLPALDIDGRARVTADAGAVAR
jgi:hypothetical protein